jgi:kynurenine formamidase
VAAERAAVTRERTTLLEKGISMIQVVTNLSQIGKSRFVLIAAPLRTKGGDASPARVIALAE